MLLRKNSGRLCKADTDFHSFSQLDFIGPQVYNEDKIWIPEEQGAA